jgi:glutamine synthetase type III
MCLQCVERIKHSKKILLGMDLQQAWETEAGRELSNFKTTPQALSESIKTSQIYSQKWVMNHIEVEARYE